MGLNIQNVCKKFRKSNKPSALYWLKIENNWHRMLTDNELSTLEALASVLEPLSHFTDALSGEKCVTVSAVRPLLSHIMDNCLRASPDDCAIVKEMKEIIGDKLQVSYLHVETSRLLDKCSNLDPRF